MQEGYDVQINDTREKHDLVFDKVTDDYWGDTEWSCRTCSRGSKDTFKRLSGRYSE